MRRGLVIVPVLALVLTLVSTAVPRTVTATYPDIMGCEDRCEVAAAGFPVAFIVDYPGISPANSADLAGAILGMDNVLWGRAAISAAFWLMASALLQRIVARRPPKPTDGRGGS